jgi:hypothetical protein
MGRVLASACSTRSVAGETEPPNLATEKNAGRGLLHGLEPQSLVRKRFGPMAQGPAESRRFLRRWRSARGKSLHPQTRWRWVQSTANSSPQSSP